MLRQGSFAENSDLVLLSKDIKYVLIAPFQLFFDRQNSLFSFSMIYCIMKMKELVKNENDQRGSLMTEEQ